MSVNRRRLLMGSAAAAAAAAAGPLGVAAVPAQAAPRGSHYMLKVFKEKGRSFIWWTDAVPEVKSFSRHEEGRGIYTTARGTGNPYGNYRVHFKWPEEVVEHRDRSSRIYKARLLNHVLPGS